MKLQVLGCSGGIGKGLKTTSFLVDNSLLIDAGTGIELLTMDEMLAIRDVVITHAHVDHIVGLPLMLATIYDQHTQPVRVHAIPEVIKALKDHIFNWTIWPDFTQLPESKPIVSLHEVNVGDTLSLQGKEVTALPAVHPTPTAGYLVKDAQSSMVFTGDSGINPELWPIINTKKPDVLIIDVSFTDEVGELAVASGHLTPSQLASELAHVNSDAKPKVFLTHLKPGFEAQIVSECQACVDGFELDQLNHNQTLLF